MAEDSYLHRHIEANKAYSELPARLKQAVSEAQWVHTAKWHCIHRGFVWADSVVRGIVSESEYFESLLTLYRLQRRVGPVLLGPLLFKHLLAHFLFMTAAALSVPAVRLFTTDYAGGSFPLLP
jgi:hypothetical protein